MGSPQGISFLRFSNSPVLCYVAAPVVPTARNRHLQPREQHRHLGVLAAGAQLQSQRSDTRVTGAEIQKIHGADPDPLFAAEELGTVAQERQSRVH